MMPRASGSQYGAPSPASAGTNDDALARRNLRRERLDLRGAADQAEPVAQPLHGRPGDEAAALERVDHLVADLPPRVESSPNRLRTGFGPVFSTTNAPVPYVHFTSPG